ncbi:MAG: zf-HC2 domain-containing protein [Kibdelosporangium sp.]
MTCRNTVSLGAYLLGALDPAERSAFEEHLTTCPTCKAELLRLAPLPGLLQRLTSEEFDAIEAGDALEFPGIPDFIDLPPEAILVEPAAGPVAEPRPAQPSWLTRNRLALLAAAAVVLLAIGGLVILQRPDEPVDALPQPNPPTSTSQATPETWMAFDQATGVTGQVELTRRGWGTEVKLSMRDVPAGRKLCHMVVYSKDGTSEEAGKWTAGTYRSVNSIPGSTSIRVADIDRIEVIAGGGVLVGLRSP